MLTSEYALKDKVISRMFRVPLVEAVLFNELVNLDLVGWTDIMRSLDGRKDKFRNYSFKDGTLTISSETKEDGKDKTVPFTTMLSFSPETKRLTSTEKVGTEASKTETISTITFQTLQYWTKEGGEIDYIYHDQGFTAFDQAETIVESFTETPLPLTRAEMYKTITEKLHCIYARSTGNGIGINRCDIETFKTKTDRLLVTIDKDEHLYFDPTDRLDAYSRWMDGVMEPKASFSMIFNRERHPALKNDTILTSVDISRCTIKRPSTVRHIIEYDFDEDLNLKSVLVVYEEKGSTFLDFTK